MKSFSQFHTRSVQILERKVQTCPVTLESSDRNNLQMKESHDRSQNKERYGDILAVAAVMDDTQSPTPIRQQQRDTADSKQVSPDVEQRDRRKYLLRGPSGPLGQLMFNSNQAHDLQAMSDQAATVCLSLRGG